MLTNISSGQLTPRLNSGLECLAERMAGAPTPGSHVTQQKTYSTCKQSKELMYSLNCLILSKETVCVQNISFATNVIGNIVFSSVKI